MKNIVILLFLIINNNLYSQLYNLVPNGDFEYYSGCPNTTGQIDSAYPWTQPLSQSTSDYYNICSNYWGTNFFVEHPPLSGSGFAGIIPLSYNNLFVEYREYISCRLFSKLKQNIKYCSKLYIKKLNNCRISINSFGILFSSNFIFQPNVNTPLIYDTQIKNFSNRMLYDSLNWMKISDSFIANGSEQFITIGCFETIDSMQIIKDSCSQFHVSYYFIDDVSVCDCDDFKPKLGIDTTLCAGQLLLLKANVPKEADSVNYTWQDGSKDSTYLVNQPGTYWVSAYIEDYKITVTDTITVNYKDCNKPIWIPNSFTPNGDGLNDIFKPVTLAELENYTMLIFNRWGQQIFESKDINKGWDGKYKGKLVEFGVYTYKIEATEKLSGEKKVYNGRVTVVN